MRAFLLMSYYVYIIQSQLDGTYYKGSSENPVRRVMDHNLGKSSYTAVKSPWKLVYVEELPNKREMLIRERNLKRGNSDYFFYLIHSERNIAYKFS
ncbi:MAG TPA: GIY-YIG nuclease family protein [Saprospiraceae bacterium]|nr:GIY-YIG nuclease family protein [Saprospiraceae bacterium]